MTKAPIFGREARSRMIPYLEGLRYRQNRRLTNELNGGTLTHDLAFGLIGKLAAIQDILDDLEGEQKEEVRQMTRVSERR